MRHAQDDGNRGSPHDPDLIERMEAIVRQMPRLTREIFLAHRVEDLPYEGIAARTGLTTRQVECHVARALILLERGLRRARKPWWRFW
jgi:DNA-directed RNA polymerase specialized sigma24 family protein